jgi:hypothetical protein
MNRFHVPRRHRLLTSLNDTQAAQIVVFLLGIPGALVMLFVCGVSAAAGRLQAWSSRIITLGLVVSGSGVFIASSTVMLQVAFGAFQLFGFAAVVIVVSLLFKSISGSQSRRE